MVISSETGEVLKTRVQFVTRIGGSTTDAGGGRVVATVHSLGRVPRHFPFFRRTCVPRGGCRGVFVRG